MDREHLDAVLKVLETRLGGLDFPTRREVLKTLLKNTTFLALLSRGGNGFLEPVLAAAQQRKTISIEALTAPAPDRPFRDQRTQLAFGTEAMVRQLIDEAIAEVLGKVGIGGLPGFVIDPGGLGQEVACGEYEIRSCDSNNCSPSNNCSGAFSCTDDVCGWNVCTDNICSEQGCGGNNDCSTSDACTGQVDSGQCAPSNTCLRESCPDNHCARNDCSGQSCPGNSCDPPSANRCAGQTHIGGIVEPGTAVIDPTDFLSRYRGEPFVSELRELFGGSVLQEIESMIRNLTSLQGRGLLDPSAPPPPRGRSLTDVLRDLPGARLPGPAGGAPGTPPGVPTPRVGPGTVPPARTPTAPAAGAPSSAPAGSPPPTTPSTPAPPATTTQPPAVGPTPPTVDPRRLPPPGGLPGSPVAPRPKAPLQ